MPSLHQALLGQVRHDDVGGSHQPVQDLAGSGRQRIERQTAFVPVPLQEAGAVVPGRSGQILEAIVAALHALDADHVGTEVTQHRRAHRAGDEPPHVDHANSVENHAHRHGRRITRSD